ncbi:MAG: aminopeptidase P N-terminal domain-containing protein, partial [Phycisphaeraceae bacterium]|nr:aminopeptidase P N-terminal domain-containing protein [Phycisphaeraceae bacterium]
MIKADDRFFPTHFTADEFADRRRRLLAEIEPDAHVLLRGRIKPCGPRFLQSKTFYYFCGAEIPGAMLLISGPEKKTTLYVGHRDTDKHPEEAGLGIEDAEQIIAALGVDDVRELYELADDLKSATTVYLQDAEDELPSRTRFEAAAFATARAEHPWDGRPSDSTHFADLVRERLPDAEIKELTPLVAEMRRVKTDQEIDVMRRAGHLSALAVTEAMRMTQPGMVERQLSAIASYIYLSHGASGEGYPQIVAAGHNMQFGHYHRNDAELADGDIVLMDSAPDYAYYTSDIGRIWPVNGTYTDWQRELYGYITVYHQTILDLLKPGKTRDQIQEEASEVMTEVFNDTDWSKDYYRAAAERVITRSNPMSHPVGLSVHDGSPYKHKPLEPG